MAFERSKKWWLEKAKNEPDCPISAGVPTAADALWNIQQIAALGIEQTNDSGPLADLFAEIHREAASALVSPEPPKNEASSA